MSENLRDALEQAKAEIKRLERWTSVNGVAELQRELEQACDANDDMRDLLREIYNLTPLASDCPVDLPRRALEVIAILIEEKTPPTPADDQAANPP